MIRYPLIALIAALVSVTGCSSNGDSTPIFDPGGGSSGARTGAGAGALSGAGGSNTGATSAGSHFGGLGGTTTVPIASSGGLVNGGTTGTWLRNSGGTNGPTPSGGTTSSPSGGASNASTGGIAQAGTGGRSSNSSGGTSNPANGGTSGSISGESGRASTGGAGGSGLGGSSPTVPGELDLIAAPNGKDSAPGTIDQPTTLSAALTRVTAGHSIFLRAGTYSSAVQLTIARDNSGAKDKPKRLAAYGSERPVLDFSTQTYGSGSNPRGLQINGNYWYVKGLEVKGAADNGIYVAGSNNVIEACVTHGNRDTGLQIGRASSDQTNPADWPSNNLILNCESYDNYDAPPGSGENADGFAAKLTVGNGNVFRGCVSHHNIDDGWDLYTKTETGPIGPVTIDRCVAYSNGTLTDGTSNDNGDRNGFKLGGDDIAVPHVVTRSVAFKNGKNGFTWNSNPGAIRLSNNLAFDNAEGNFKFGDNSTNTAAVFTNNVSLWTSTGSTQSDKAMGTDVANSNVWWDKSKSSVNAKGLVATSADFASSLTTPKLSRAADGSLDFSTFSLASGSDLANAGVVPEGSLPFEPADYYLGAPDLGAEETR
ncbi:MAG TPA: hypothetical protein VFQ61_14590 [Polyangiaceae bacterium]|nr:hypothetical protein [Polyangiaceae bacterium]